MPQPALLAHDLVRTLGDRRVLDGVSLTASPGHRIGLLDAYGGVRLEQDQERQNRRSCCCSTSPPTTCHRACATNWRQRLGTGPGAIVVASHDRWLRKRWRGRSGSAPDRERHKPYICRISSSAPSSAHRGRHTCCQASYEPPSIRIVAPVM
jgi:hypothetical protein